MSNTEYEDKKFHYPIMWSELNESGHVKFDQEMEEKYGVSLYEVEKNKSKELKVSDKKQRSMSICQLKKHLLL